MGHFLKPIAVAAATLLLATWGCGSHNTENLSGSAPGPGETPTRLADTITRAIYDNKPDVARTYFDDALKSQIEDFQVLFMSQTMHRLGDYDGVKIARADVDHGRYAYRAFFSRGKMEVRLRVDNDGKAAAYRIVPAPIGQP